MKIRCLACGKEWEKPGGAALVSHGICEGECDRIFNNWVDLPSPRIDLRIYYKMQTTLNSDRAQLNALGGKWN